MPQLVHGCSDAPPSPPADGVGAPRRSEPPADRSDNKILLRVVQTLIGWEWPMRLMNPLLRDFNPFLPEFRADPYPSYRRLQAKHRVYFNRLLAGTCLLPRHDDIVAVLADPRFSVDRPSADIFKRLNPFRGLSPEFVAAINTALLMLDPPAHTRLRRLVNKAFTPRVVEGLR